ncbi:MAG: hypothetical protein NZM04_06670 [Methylacidiphilales bacterium]|nr:hypothetical protein [Candidatus Methylacidiphilales bacterium]
MRSLSYFTSHKFLMRIQHFIERKEWEIHWGRIQMRNNARKLLSALCNSQSKDARLCLPIHFLTGKKYWYQTLFCIFSLQNHITRPIKPIIYDDGTFDHNLLQLFNDVLPLVVFKAYSELFSDFESNLPPNRYPTLHLCWHHYPHIRKLICPHLGSQGWKLMIDSDILFYRKPSLLIEQIDNPKVCLFGMDSSNYYGYPISTLEKIAQNSIPNQINVGICGINSSDLDWDFIEYAIKQLYATHGHSYYLEQALIAIHAARYPYRLAPANEYVTNPSLPEAINCTAICHHYTSESKIYYFKYNWKKVLNFNRA